MAVPDARALVVKSARRKTRVNRFVKRGVKRAIVKNGREIEDSICGST